MLALVAALLSTAPVAEERDANPLAPTASGKMQCYAPDREKRTCRALASYVSNGAGGYENRAVLLVSPAPLITLETVSQVVVKQGEVCGAVRLAELKAGVIRRGGKALPADQAGPLLAAIESGLAPMLNREVCTRYIASGDHFVARATLDGVKDRLRDDDVIWVSPQDGYRVAG